jgi:hypothetical protein
MQSDTINRCAEAFTHPPFRGKPVDDRLNQSAQLLLVVDVERKGVGPAGLPAHLSSNKDRERSFPALDAQIVLLRLGASIQATRDGDLELMGEPLTLANARLQSPC